MLWQLEIEGEISVMHRARGGCFCRHAQGEAHGRPDPASGEPRNEAGDGKRCLAPLQSTGIPPPGCLHHAPTSLGAMEDVGQGARWPGTQPRELLSDGCHQQEEGDGKNNTRFENRDVLTYKLLRRRPSLMCCPT